MIPRSTKDNCTKRQCFWGVSTTFWIRPAILTAFCAWDSSPHLPVTPAQLMRPGIGRNMSCAVGDFAQHLSLFLREMWVVDRSCTSLHSKSKEVAAPCLNASYAHGFPLIDQGYSLLFSLGVVSKIHKFANMSLPSFLQATTQIFVACFVHVVSCYHWWCNLLHCLLAYIAPTAAGNFLWYMTSDVVVLLATAVIVNIVDFVWDLTWTRGRTVKTIWTFE